MLHMANLIFKLEFYKRNREKITKRVDLSN